MQITLWFKVWTSNWMKMLMQYQIYNRRFISQNLRLKWCIHDVMFILECGALEYKWAGPKIITGQNGNEYWVGRTSLCCGHPLYCGNYGGWPCGSPPCVDNLEGKANFGFQLLALIE